VSAEQLVDALEQTRATFLKPPVISITFRKLKLKSQPVLAKE
jgi:hypothetical protein